MGAQSASHRGWEPSVAWKQSQEEYRKEQLGPHLYRDERVSISPPPTPVTEGSRHTSWGPSPWPVQPSFDRQQGGP